MAEKTEIIGTLRRDGERSGVVLRGERPPNGPMAPGEPSDTAVAGRSFYDLAGELKAVKADLDFVRAAAKTVLDVVATLRAIVTEIRSDLLRILGEPAPGGAGILPASCPGGEAGGTPAPHAGPKPYNFSKDPAKDDGVLAQTRDAAAEILRYNDVPLSSREIVDFLATKMPESKETILGRLKAALRHNPEKFEKHGAGHSTKWTLREA